MDDDDFTIVIPREFHPPRLADTPDSLFSQRVLPGMARPRFVRKTDKNQVIFWTDGACLNNGKANPSAGGGFVFSTPNVKHDGKYHGIHFRLENEGPNGNIEAQTSNRAELRAVIAALEFKDRSPEGWKSLVIATDSEYVVHGATDWITKWMDNNWKRSSGDAVKNRDLWELLMDNISRYEELGIEILFWKIPRELNKLADQKAKEGAALPAIDEWNPVYSALNEPIKLKTPMLFTVLQSLYTK
ncbi:putative Ribonuclease H [Glarea lozoyensis 74030]|uniref:ribonuclease H n=1 Tax=Glarea lozoyensis (strain ATCC 74030 / MF5533) TaxID=1104152 RepID=H0EJB7_GLAL7|nr:putative Ribonuclease H [Glarea lozoyensis 74030]